jgi:arsenite-transporting ATPase
MVGVEELRELGAALFPADEDPAEVLFRGKPYEIRREAGGYVLLVQLPFATKEDVSLTRQGDELVLRVGGLRRTLLLPRALIDARAKGASMVDHTLRIEFEAREPAPHGGRR